MNQQKGFANIVLIVLIVVLAGVVGYFALVKKTPEVAQQINSSTPTSTQTQNPIPTPTPSDETANWKTYKNGKNNFSFRYPNKWSLSNLGHDNISLKDESGKEVIHITLRLRNLDYDFQNTLEKAIKSSAGGNYMGVEKTENLILQKIADDARTLGYISQWNITSVNKTFFLESRADLESKLEQPLTAETGKYKTVFSFVGQQDFKDFSLLKSIALSFSFNP